MTGIRCTRRVELVDSATLEVIAAFPTMRSALFVQAAHRRPTVARYVDGPSCADCDEPPVAHTEAGLRCADHLRLDRIHAARAAHPSAWTDEALDRLLSDVLTHGLDDELAALLDEGKRAS